MEFIPLETYSKNTRNKKDIEETVQNKKLNDNNSVKSAVKKSKIKAKPKPKPKPVVFEKKNVKKKYKETLESKQKEKALKKKLKKSKRKEEEADDGDMKLDVSQNDEDEDEEKEDDEEDEEKEYEEADEEKKDDEEAFKKKCKIMDEKKKNRLFVKLKKKIHSEAEIKELHPDIRGVIFPRKKYSRWCWAVFASEEKANKAMKQMAKNKEILVSKPNPYDKVYMKNKEKLKTVLRKKEAKKKLQNIWM